ncbi:hypothetical protein quinque_005811 [Culex quinquefasciatus]
MVMCRLCGKDSPKNDILKKDRHFQEKANDVICMWLITNKDSLPNDVCDPCQTQVEQCYTFKHACRSTQQGFKSGAIALPKPPAPLVDCSDIVQQTLDLITSLAPPRKRGRPPKENRQPPAETASVRVVKMRRKNGHRLMPYQDENGNRLLVPRPWARKYKEAAYMSTEQYRKYATRMDVKARPKKTIVCDECGKEIPETRIDGHRNRHLGLTPYECEKCGDKFHCKMNRRNHELRNHVVGEKRSCETCGKEFTSNMTYKQHVRVVHGERRYACTICPLKMASKTALTTHLKMHNQTRDFKCAECGKKFYAKSVLNIHMRTHSGERPYRCSVEGCGGEGFVHRNMYVFHMERNHPGEPLMYLEAKGRIKESWRKKLASV